MITLPFGIALQNLANFAGLIIISITAFKIKGWRENFASIPKSLKLAWLFLVLFILCEITGGILNTNVNNHLGSYIAGRLSLVIFPFAITMLGGKSAFKSLKSKKKIFIGILSFWCIILVSQFFHSWGIRQAELVSYGNRPEGFYSNALTTAYVLFIIFPFIGTQFFTKRNTYWAISFALILTSIAVNNSRTIIATAALIIGFNILFYLRGKVRLLTVVGGLVVGGVILSTNNPISFRLKNLFNQSEKVTYRGYSDHRLVFWDIYTDMIKEKPFFGHGPKLTRDYHVPYYDARGFNDFEKKYEAHNQLLQVAGNSGLLGLTFFVLWTLFTLKSIYSCTQDMSLRLAFMQTILGFMLAGLTQNAFQDAEVRQAYMLLCVGIVMFSSSPLKKLGGTEGQ